MKGNLVGGAGKEQNEKGCGKGNGQFLAGGTRSFCRGMSIGRGQKKEERAQDT